MAIDFGFEPTKNESGFAFVSYARADGDAVRDYCGRLHALGIDMWYDKAIKPFVEFDEEIIKQIGASNCFVCFISRNYADSVNCLTESSYAFQNRKRIIPVFIEEMNALPNKLQYVISSTNYYYAYLDDIDQAVDVIADGVRRAASGSETEWSAWNGTNVHAAKSENQLDKLIADGYTYIEHYKKNNTDDDLTSAKSKFGAATDEFPSDPRGWIGLIDVFAVDRTADKRSSYLESLSNVEKYYSYVDEKYKDQYRDNYNAAITNVLRKELGRLNVYWSQYLTGSASSDDVKFGYDEYTKFLREFLSPFKNSHINLPVCAELKAEAEKALAEAEKALPGAISRSKKKAVSEKLKSAAMSRADKICLLLFPVFTVLFVIMELPLFLMIFEDSPWAANALTYTFPWCGDILQNLGRVFENQRILMAIILFAWTAVINLGSAFFWSRLPNVEFSVFKGALSVQFGTLLLGLLPVSCSAVINGCDACTSGKDIGQGIMATEWHMLFLIAAVVAAIIGALVVVVDIVLSVYAIIRVVWSFVAHGASNAIDRGIK